MRATKVFLLAIALIGMSAVWQPMITVHTHGIPFKVTARELSFGFERTHKVLDFKIPGFVEKRIPQDYVDARDDARLVGRAVKWAFALYIPIGLLLLLGIGAQFGGRLTRSAAIMTIFLGAVMTASWFVLRYAIDYGLSELALKRTTVTLAPGGHILLICGLAAVLVGLVGASRPEKPTGMTTMMRAVEPPPGVIPPPA